MPEHPPSERSPSALGLALGYLRSAAVWSKARLARALGRDTSLISHYERGKPLTREQLESFLDSLRYPSEAVDVLLFAHDLIFPEPLDEPASPVALSPQERRVIDRAVMAAGWTVGHVTAGEVRGELIRRRKEEKVEAARQEAEGLFKGLMAATREERAALVEAFPEYWNWALAVRLCEHSVKRAAHRAEEALELAHLALAIAERVPGEESWRLIRLVWLESRVAAGEGRPEEAVASLEQVRGYFTARELPYDAALSSLDLAVLYLKVGCAVQVKELAVAMGWIFKAEGIDREALEALKLFCDAARQERASVELARQVAAEIEKARRSAPPTGNERDRG